MGSKEPFTRRVNSSRKCDYCNEWYDTLSYDECPKLECRAKSVTKPQTTKRRRNYEDN